MSRFWSDTTQNLTPYVPGEQPKIANLIKLNTNEHPHGPSTQVIEAIQAATSDALRLYPDPEATALKQTLASYYQVKPEQVFVGNGSDEVLGHIFQGLLKHEAPLLFPDISYSFYPVYCGLYGINYRPVPLDDELCLCPQDYMPGPDQPVGGIIFPNPNAPTGRLLALTAIEQILNANPDVVVVVDEAYIDFGGESAISLVSRYPNLLVVQTLSKSRALAGLRVGFAIGDAHLIEGLERVKNSFNSYPLDRLAIAGAVAAFKDTAWFEKTRQDVISWRETLTTDLQTLGFEVLPSAANFIFVRHPECDAGELAAGLREQGIIVRHFKQARIQQYLRITIGWPEQHKALLSALKPLLSRSV